MPPTISVTDGKPDVAAFCPVAEPLADELPELPQAARPAARIPVLAAAPIAVRGGLNMRVLLVSVRVVSLSWRWTGIQAAAASAGDGGRQDSRRRSSRAIRPSAVSARTA